MVAFIRIASTSTTKQNPKPWARTEPTVTTASAHQPYYKYVPKSIITEKPKIVFVGRHLPATGNGFFRGLASCRRVVHPVPFRCATINYPSSMLPRGYFAGTVGRSRAAHPVAVDGFERSWFSYYYYTYRSFVRKI